MAGRVLHYQTLNPYLHVYVSTVNDEMAVGRWLSRKKKKKDW